MTDLHVWTGVPLTLMSWEKRRYHLQTIRQDILNYACTCPADKLQVLLQIGSEIYIWCQSYRFLNRSNHFRLSHGKYPETIHAIDYPHVSGDRQKIQGQTHLDENHQVKESPVIKR
ncbi:hypothetical protein CDAR_540061 [Caerostris darwini]|uniref:Uncharacterized protein n=1 Tax=Caerostris darwini TaxID=1538125 RepID=A0AAV4TKR4_9ARAC|nr:hypothetical protein CDAR_540061 [Caerostris darwini]